MNISESMLSILRCPETRQPLVRATSEEVAAINDALAESKIEGALLRQDRLVAYRIDDGYPVLLLDGQLRRPDGATW